MLVVIWMLALLLYHCAHLGNSSSLLGQRRQSVLVLLDVLVFLLELALGASCLCGFPADVLELEKAHLAVLDLPPFALVSSI